MDFLPKISSCLLAALLLGGLLPVHAVKAAEPIMVLAQLGPLPPEQRRQMREQMREHWQQLPEEERQRFREERRERREAHQLLPPEDRSRMRDELRGWRDSGGEGRGEGGYGRRHGRP